MKATSGCLNRQLNELETLFATVKVSVKDTGQTKVGIEGVEENIAIVNKRIQIQRPRCTCAFFRCAGIAWIVQNKVRGRWPEEFVKRLRRREDLVEGFSWLRLLERFVGRVDVEQQLEFGLQFALGFG